MQPLKGEYLNKLAGSFTLVALMLRIAVPWSIDVIRHVLFDVKFQGNIEFIGRALAKPVVKLAHEPYEKPFFPPVLQWFPIYRGDTKAGELLAAFEMFHVSGILFTFNIRILQRWIA